MKTKLTKNNKTIRFITLGLFILAILAYYLPTLFFGGRIAVGWLVVGVIHTILFSLMFFRDSRRRTALSIIIMILNILWSLGLLLMLSQLASVLGFNIIPLGLYTLCSLLASIFALANPRRYIKVTGVDDTVEYGEVPEDESSAEVSVNA